MTVITLLRAFSGLPLMAQRIIERHEIASHDVQKPETQADVLKFEIRLLLQ